MDLWVVAAATGAGYIAKYLQNLSRENEDSSELYPTETIHGQYESRNLLRPIQDQTRPLHRLAQNPLGRDVGLDREDDSNRRFSEIKRLGHDLGPEVASTSNGYGDGLANFGKNDDYNLLSLASVPPGLYGRQNFQGIADGSNERRGFPDQLVDSLPDFSSGETSSYHKVNNRSKLLKSRRPHEYSIKPLNSLESCLTAQLHREHAKLEEYVYSSLASPSTPAVRPLLVTDGSRIISRASSDFKAEMRFGIGEDRTILGTSPLPKRSMEVQRRPRQSFGKLQSRRLSSSTARVSTGPFNSQGPPNGMLLFFLGITIGLIFNVLNNKREVDKLNELLKKSENLVQDLQEELEMKDMLTVKELPSEGCNSPETNQLPFLDWNPTNISTEEKLNGPIKCDENDPDHQKVEYSESMSKIEAELEAELERLELNMKASSLERISDFVEVDPNFVPDVVEGELRADALNRQLGGLSDSDDHVSGISTYPIDTANDAVSPRELSLRLHEVIQSRLEERILELEMALQESQRRVGSVELKRVNSQRDLYSEVESSSTQGSPISADEGNDIDQPLVINLSGEALDAYDEAYEEIFRMAKTDEETPPDTMYNSDHIGDYTYYQGQNGEEANGLDSYQDLNEERCSRNLVRDKIRTWEERSSRSRASIEVDDESEDEDSDELGRLLIKQIVEKARQGSPVVLNAQRVLYSMDDHYISESDS